MAQVNRPKTFTSDGTSVSQKWVYKQAQPNVPAMPKPLPDFTDELGSFIPDAPLGGMYIKGHEFGDSAPSQPDQDGYWALVELVDGIPATITGYKVEGNFWSYWDDSTKHVVDTLPKGLWLFIS